MISQGFAPTSESQFQAWQAGRVPELESVSPGVWCVAMPVTDSFWTLCYLIGDESGIAVVDPGVDTDANWGRLVDALRQGPGLGADSIEFVLVTHLHADHLGLAPRIRAASGARIVLHRLEQLAIREGRASVGEDGFDRWGVPGHRRPELLAIERQRRALKPIDADMLIEHGDVVRVPGRALEAIWTPGHTYGHVCFRDPAAGLVFTGDHVLPMLNSGVGLGGASESNPLADYLSSLDAIAGFDSDEALPGHGYRFRGLAARCDSARAHLLARRDEVAAALDGQSGTTLWELAGRIAWTGGFESLRGGNLANALAQTAMHVRLLGRESELAGFTA